MSTTRYYNGMTRRRINHPDWPETADDAVDRLVASLSEQNKQAIREAESLFLFHFTLGCGSATILGCGG